MLTSPLIVIPARIWGHFNPGHHCWHQQRLAGKWMTIFCSELLLLSVLSEMDIGNSRMLWSRGIIFQEHTKLPVYVGENYHLAKWSCFSLVHVVLRLIAVPSCMLYLLFLTRGVWIVRVQVFGPVDCSFVQSTFRHCIISTKTLPEFTRVSVVHARWWSNGLRHGFQPEGRDFDSSHGRSNSPNGSFLLIAAHFLKLLYIKIESRRLR